MISQRYVRRIGHPFGLNCLFSSRLRATRLPITTRLLNSNSSASQRPRWKLSTLNPLHLTTADYTVLSDSKSQCQLGISLIGKPSFPIYYFFKGADRQPFPPRTAGFFYYHIPRDLPPMAGGLRFRITAHENPASFEDGHDLLHDGLPWQISLHAITTAVGPRAVLREQLLHERLIMQADLDHCRAMMQKKQRLDPNYMLYRLAQPFVIHFHRKLHAWVVGETEVKPWAHDMFAEHRVQYTREHRSHSIWPYTGSALAQFELSTLPEHAGSDTVVMRIVKILARPTCVVPGYDGSIPTPVEGELVHHTTNRAPVPRLQPWSRKLAPDSSKFTAALRMLVENTRRWPVE